MALMEHSHTHGARGSVWVVCDGRTKVRTQIIEGVSSATVERDGAHVATFVGFEDGKGDFERAVDCVRGMV